MNLSNTFEAFIREHGKEIVINNVITTFAVVTPLTNQGSSYFQKEHNRLGRDCVQYFTYIGLDFIFTVIKGDKIVMGEDEYRVEEFEKINAGDKLAYSRGIISKNEDMYSWLG
ncbi:MAG: hypothetical protein FWG69_04110 [Oscillospiraceae bacterium]|nr:hypothetical protein [Oscillospiraceae bacterium]